MAQQHHLDAGSTPNPGAPADRDEQLGEAIEAYLELAEAGNAPEPEEFAARYPELHGDLKAALEGLSLVRGLVGAPFGPGARLESGRRIAGYRIVGELGRGGMGIVYEAVHMDLDRPVALKVLGGHAAPDSSSRRRFLNEARTAAGLHHTHIVPVFDVGQVGGLCYYAMQRIEGSGLDRVVRHLRRDRATAAGAGSSLGSASVPGLGRAAGFLSRVSSNLARGGGKRAPSNGLDVGEPSALPAPAKGRTLEGDATATWHGGSAGASLGLLHDPRPERDDGPPPFVPPRGSGYFRWVAAVGRMAAEALAFAHQRGIIHRDVKPSNLLVDARGHVWMTDFGLARRLADPGLTHHDGMLGTPRYMSPEQSRSAPVDGRSDVYSLGATLYELLTLRPPFEGKSAAELADQIRDREPVAPRRIDPRIPRDLETVVLKALAKRPGDRYADAQALAEDLARFLRFEPVRARRISPAGQLWRFARRHPALSSVTTAAAVTVMSVVTFAHFEMKRERDDAVRARERMEKAYQSERAARAKQFASEAKTLLNSSALDRRTKGLDLLKEAATLGPDPALRAQLRDEAVELLVLRDVEQRAGFGTEHARAIAFSADGARLAVLSDDGKELGLWDVATRQPLEARALRAEASSAADNADAPAGKSNGRRRPGGAGLAAVGARLVMAWPEGHGFRLLDANTGALVCDVDTAGRTVVAVAGAAEGERFVTVETVPPARPAGGPPPVPSRPRVRLWDARPNPDDPSAAPRPIGELGSWAPFSIPLVAISPDGHTVVTAPLGGGASGGTTISLWSGDDGKALSSIDSQTELTALAIGPRGRLTAAGGGAIRIWDVASRTQRPSLNTPRAYLGLLRFSPDGHLLAAAGGGADVELWDIDAHALVALLPTGDRGVSDVAFAPDGKSLAAAGRQGETAVWSILDPEGRFQFSKTETFAPPLAFRADGLLAVGSATHEVRFWRPGHGLNPCPNADAAGADEASKPAAGGPVPQVPGRRGTRFDQWDRPLAMGFDDRGRLLALGPSWLRLWPEPAQSAGSRWVPLFLDGGPGFFAAPLARTADGRTFYFARRQYVMVWRAGDPAHWRLVGAPAADPDSELDDITGFDEGTGPGDWLTWRALAVAPGGNRLYLLDNAGDAHAWALDESGAQAVRQEWLVPGDAWNLALGPDGRTLALGERGGAVLLLDAAHGTVRARLQTASAEPSAGASGARGSVALAFAPGGRELAVGTAQGQVQIWMVADPSAPEPLVRLPGHHGFTTLAYGPNGRYLATAGGDRLIDVWDLPRIRSTLGQLGLGW